jgi:hypothetical protein
MDRMNAADLLLYSARVVITVACFRVLPIAAFVLLTPKVGVPAKVVIGLTAVGAAVAVRVWSMLPLGWIAGAYAYFCLACLLLPLGSRWLRAGRLTSGALFVACAAGFLVLPGLPLPVEAKGTALVLGFDFMLSSYSYVVETARSRDAPRLGDSLFFVLVNPALVYAERGEQVSSPGLDARGLGRLTLGAATLFGAALVSLGALGWIQRHAALVGHGALLIVLLAALNLLAEYWRHSGLASLQLGMMRQLGYAVPERYRFPFLAKDPLDFWQRWNVYLGGWLQRYVFWPLSLHAGRGGGSVRKRLALGAGVLVTFGAVGLLHDGHRYVSDSLVELRAFRPFLACGVLVLSWAGVRELLRGPVRVPRWLERPFAPVRRLVFWVAMLGLFVWYTA